MLKTTNLKQPTMKHILKLSFLAFIITLVSCKDDKTSGQNNAENTAETEQSNSVEDEQKTVTNFKTYTGKELNDWLPNTILEYVKEPTSLEFGSETLHQIKAYFNISFWISSFLITLKQNVFGYMVIAHSENKCIRGCVHIHIPSYRSPLLHNIHSRFGNLATKVKSAWWNLKP